MKRHSHIGISSFMDLADMCPYPENANAALVGWSDGPAGGNGGSSGTMVRAESTP
jgi:hypothetical protein